MPAPDLLILTAANDVQARGYELQLAARRERGLIAPRTRTLVVPDSGGRRIGSGASTFLALRAAAAALAGESRRSLRGDSFDRIFARRNVLVLHSGGDSRRLPAFAALGKVFVPLPLLRGGAPGTLIDLVVEDLAGCFDDPRGRIVIAAGDLVVGLRGAAIRTDADVVGLATPKPISVGRRHGVFVSDRTGRWLDFLQKPTATAMRERGALCGDPARRRASADARSSEELVLVDTGVVSLSPHAAGVWLHAAGARQRAGRTRSNGLLAAIERGEAPALDLYVHLLSAFARRLDEAAYLGACGPGASDRAAELLALREVLRRCACRVAVAEDAEFFHLGTTRELLEGLFDPASAERFGFFRPRDMLRGVSYERTLSHHARRWQTPKRGRGAPLHSIAESCPPDALSAVEGGNLVVGVPPTVRPLALPPGWCLTALPVGARNWAVLCHHASDDFKTPLRDGGTLGAKSWRKWLAGPAGTAISRSVAEEAALYDAALWPVSTIDRAVAATTWMLGGPASPPNALWRRLPKRSLRQLVQKVNHARVLDGRAASARAHGRAWLASRLLMPHIGVPCDARELLALARDGREARGLATALAECVQLPGKDAHPSTERRAARALVLAGVLSEAFPSALRGHPALRPRRRLAAALERIGRSVRPAVPAAPPLRRGAAPPVGSAARATAPVRIDLAGGWTDTSPISEEHGGAVVNLAVTLEGRAPVEAFARVIAKPRIVVHSVDANASRRIDGAEELADHADPRDWAALPKAALVLSGFAPGTRGASLSRHLARFGGGVELWMRSNVPRGSGLGTSSILAAALLAALARLRGEALGPSELFGRTSLAEQMIATRGGWQDQIGGAVPGLKIARTERGEGMAPSVEPIRMPRRAHREFAARSILLFTGQRRMARGILGTVVGRYLASERAVLEAIPRLKAGAEALAGAARAGDVDEMARWFGDYWRLKQVVDPASTTPSIEALIEPHLARLSAWGLTGAGGGGFALLVAKDEQAAARVRRELSRAFGEGGGEGDRGGGGEEGGGGGGGGGTSARERPAKAGPGAAARATAKASRAAAAAPLPTGDRPRVYDFEVAAAGLEVHFSDAIE